jgi:SAM-dependent methyltransferase
MAAERPMLCIGSHEDSAFGALRKLGFPVVGIDPAENDVYFSEFFHRARSRGDQFSCIFSTSVLEHVMNDELFIEQMAALLAPGGIGMLTCDFRDDWRPGQPKPNVDHRLYTRWDFHQRLIPLLEGCYLIDPPRWECEKPDFVFEGRYKYTFATLCFRRKEAAH